MRPNRERQSSHRATIVAAIIACGAMSLTGCAVTVDGNAEGAAQPSGTSSETTLSKAAPTDEETCASFGDVLTIVANADQGLRDDRMAEQERDGWHRLATRVLDRLPVTGEGGVSDAIRAAQDVAPPIALGVMMTTTFDTDEWSSAYWGVQEACGEVGAELALDMYTGG